MTNKCAAILLLAALVLMLSFKGVLRPIKRDSATPGLLQFSPALPDRAQARRTSAPDVRVMLTPQPVRKLTVQISGPYRIQLVGGSRVIDRGSKLGPIAVTSSPTGLRFGTNNFPITRLEIIPEKSPAIWIDDHQYRGSVRLFPRPGDKIVAVNKLPLEEYLASVIDSEMPAKFPVEARKAQAIAARTYALYHVQRRTGVALFDLYASTRSQKYLGYQYRSSSGRLLAGESAASRQIAEQTRGMVCTYSGKLFCAYYCAVCGGRTLLGREMFSDAADVLTSVPCNWCRQADSYRWSTTVSRNKLQEGIGKLLAKKGVRFGTLQSIGVAVPPSTGRLTRFVVRDERNAHQITSTQLQAILEGHGLRSPHFSLHRQGDRFLVSGRGHGHGVGLCQWGARGLALEGRNAMQILAYYYPGAQVVVIESR